MLLDHGQRILATYQQVRAAPLPAHARPAESAG